jgi:nicotinamide riboside kinase
MRIAFTGASSTGKTTLARALGLDSAFRAVVPGRINVDGRNLLRELGHASGVDSMSRDSRRAFQVRYLAQKRSNEDGQERYLTERSFVDIAAFWIDTSTDPTDVYSEFVRTCETEARRYDLHIYLPAGVIPLETDGLRSNDVAYHATIDASIRRLLREWRLRFVELNMCDLEARVSRVREAIRGGA